MSLFTISRQVIHSNASILGKYWYVNSVVPAVHLAVLQLTLWKQGNNYFQGVTKVDD